MIRKKSSLGLMGLVIFLVPALAILGAGINAGNAFAEGGDWKDVTVLYTTDLKGKIDPCG